MVSHQPLFDQVMLLTDQFSQWSVICDDQLFCSCNSLLLVFYNMHYYSYYYCRIVPFIIEAIQLLLKSSLHRRIDSMCMRKVKHRTSCLPQLSIVNYS